MVAEDLPPELDHRGVDFVQAGGALAILDGVDDGGLDAFLQSFRLVRDPFELAVHLARGGENRDLTHAWGEAGLVAQIPVECARMLGSVRAVELDAARALQTCDRCARR